MKNIILLLLMIIFSFFYITSCQIKKEAVGSNREGTGKVEMVKLDFEILSDEISLDEINEINEIDDYRKKSKAYWDVEILATLKQINKSSENIELVNLIVCDNFEIINLKKENKDDLIIFYDHTLILDPETYETIGFENILLKPKEYSIDSMNLVDDFRFYLSDPDTLLIRIKKQYFGKEIHSNWDTLIIN